MDIKMVCIKIKEVFIFGFSVIGVIWTVMEIIEKFFPKFFFIPIYTKNIWFLIVPAVFFALIKLVLILLSEWNIKCTIGDIKVVVKVGNILNYTDGIIVVGVNNQMNTNKDCIAKRSIHSKLIDKHGQEELTRAFENGKRNKNNERLFFQDEICGKSFLFLLMSDINMQAASSTTHMLKHALDSLFLGQATISVPEKRMYFPVLGTGAGGIQPSKQDVVKIIIDSYLNFQRCSDEETISKIKTMDVIIYWNDIFEINWSELRKWLENQKDYCLNCKK